MRFYNCDGTCDVYFEDPEFGWWLCDFSHDHLNENNVQKTLSKPQKKKTKNYNSAIKKLADIEIHVPTFTQSSLSQLEGLIRNHINCFLLENNEGTQMDYMNFLSGNLPQLISNITFEGNFLLSFIDFSKLKKINSSITTCSNNESIFEREGPSVFADHPFVHSHRNFDFTENQILVLESTKTRTIDSINILYEKIQILSSNIKEMQNELIRIRLDLQMEDKRTARILRESRKMSQEFKESNYFNEVLLLLMGKTEKIKSNTWPFKFSSSPDPESNFII